MASYEIGWHLQIGTMFVPLGILTVIRVLVFAGVAAVATAGNPHLGV